MKVVQMNISQSQTNSAIEKWSYVKLFQTEEGAINHINTEFPNSTEVTEKLKKEQYWRDDVPRTFEFTKEQFDNDGGYDYPIESVITVEWVEVL